MKNKILKCITMINFLALLFFISIIDSDSYIPAVMCFVCLGWFGALMYANRERLSKYD